MTQDTLKVMIVQQAAIYNDTAASLDLATSYIHAAREEKIDLLVFGECWLTGYPVWLDCGRDLALWDHAPLKEVYAELWTNSLSVDGQEMNRLQETIKSAGVMVCLGFNEKVMSGPGNRSLYNSFVIIDEYGQIVHHHRKIMPTHTERLVHAQGDGRGLKTIETKWGRLGGLICWEHWMPLTRQAMHQAGEHIHIALWPNVHEMLQVASRHYAFEGRCYVIAVGQVMQAQSLPKQLEYHPLKVPDDGHYVLNGQSCIFGPDGKELLPPQGPDHDYIIFDIENLGQVIEEQMSLDVAGHYSRPDLFEFGLKR